MSDDRQYWKATRTDGTSFYDQKTAWVVGSDVTHPAPDLSAGLCSSGVLHASDAPAETLVGGSWPCRLFRVEPIGDVVANGHKVGAAAWKVLEEVPAHQALGPNGEAVAALIERARTLAPEEAQRLYAAWDAARYAAGDAAVDAARYAAGDAARYAAWALVVRDVITEKQFDLLYGPWRKVIG